MHRIPESALRYDLAKNSSETGQTAFLRFPVVTSLETDSLPLESLAYIALRESHATSPIYRIHRWFARRLSSQFRAILAAASLDENDSDRFWERYFGHIPLDGATILDPFVGGGTSVVEALRCGARVLGYDVDPVATAITRLELSLASYGDLPADAARISAAVSCRIRPFHKATVDGDEVDILHHFWVELRVCEVCGHLFEVHPHYRLAFDRGSRVQWTFCHECHQVHELPLSESTLNCSCGATTLIEQGTLSRGKLTCPHCSAIRDLSARGRQEQSPPIWHLFAQEYAIRGSNGVTRCFKRADDEDRSLYRQAEQVLDSLERHEEDLIPWRTIPVRESTDRRPHIHGFRKYRELFNGRQLLHLALLAREIRSIADPRVKHILALAFSEHLTTNCMYTGYAFGYRRASPLFSIHAYRHITRPVELNPWLADAGRGTFPNALRKMSRAIEYAKKPSMFHPAGGSRLCLDAVELRGGTVSITPTDLLVGRSEAAIVTRSAIELTDLPASSVDLVLTDPPYFDNVSYSELSDFYLAWHQMLGLAEPPYDDATRSAPILENLALSSRSNEAINRYSGNLATILAQCCRVLRPDGLCIFTYHHRSWKAWEAVGQALARSRLRCSHVVPLRGEGQGGLHTFKGTIKWDAVLVCRKVEGNVAFGIESVVVPELSTVEGLEQVRMYRSRFASHPKLGFQEPDQLNLLRAHVIATAIVGLPTDGLITLETALKGTQKMMELV